MIQKIYAIKCTACAAPLSIRGGGRVSTIICEYCKSQLDLNDNYKILAQFQKLPRPDVPFSLGMRGIIKDVKWIIIAHISYVGREYIYDTWNEFFLYSPTHGYAWLLYEKGKISFSKRIRDFDLHTWKKQDRPKTLFYNGGHYLLSEEVYGANIDIVEGELTWVAKRKDHMLCWDYSGVNGRSLSIERTYDEIEVYLNEKLNTKTVYESFSVPKEKRIEEEINFFQVTSSDIIEEKNHLLFHSLIALFLLLVFTIIYAIYSPKQIDHFSTSDVNHISTFSVKSSDFLTKIELTSTMSKTLDIYSLSLYKENKKLLYINQNRVYFTKSKIKDSWNKSAKWAKIYLKLDEGQYTLKVKKRIPSMHKITIDIEENVIRFFYLIPVFILTAFFLLYINGSTLNWKYYMSALTLGFIIWGYTVYGEDILYVLLLFIFYVYDIYDSYINDNQ